MNITTYFEIAKAFIKTPAFKRQAAQVLMVATAAVIGGVVATKLDPTEVVETIVETTTQVSK